MDRFKITDTNLKHAKAFLKTGKGKHPVWTSKYKDDLTFKGNKLYYKEREVVSRERVDDVLRKELYRKDGDIPSGRDSAFHICKQRYVGISRRAIMEFIRKQKPLGEVKSSLNKPKQAGGEKLKNYIFETDLIFLKKRDLEQANPQFFKDDMNELTYFLSTVEKVTGLCRFDYVLSKNANVITPKVIAHCEDMAKELKTTIAKCDIRMDKGGEFKITELAKHFKKAEHVNSGVAVENKNAQFQKCFFQILRQRKATSIEDAMRQGQKLLNNTYNRIHKKTSNELVKRGDEKENIKEYNDERKKFVAGDKRKPFEVGQHVRLLVKEHKKRLDYKRYKDMTYSKQVYVINKITKKTTPRKYRVNGRWWLQSDLLKSAPRDEESNKLMDERDEDVIIKKKKELKKHIDKRSDEIEAQAKASKRPQRQAAMDAKVAMLQNIAILDKFDDNLYGLQQKKKQRPQKSAKHEAMIDYLKKAGLPVGGSMAVLKARIKAYKKTKKKKKKIKTMVV